MSHGWFTCPKCNIHYFDAEEHICPSRKAMTQSQSTDDLVERLRESVGRYTPGVGRVCAAAADTIERLQADLAARDKTIETLRDVINAAISTARSEVKP